MYGIRYFFKSSIIDYCISDNICWHKFGIRFINGLSVNSKLKDFEVLQRIAFMTKYS